LGEKPPVDPPPQRDPGSVSPVAMVIGVASLVLLAVFAFSVCQSMQSP
jgi:hypothetical protein